jgi:hypothetical protein
MPGRTKNVRVRGDIRDRLKKLVREKKNQLGLPKYRSLTEAASKAVEEFLIKEMQPNPSPANGAENQS